MLHIAKFTFNPFQENTYLLYSENGNGWLIDPGCWTHEEENLLKLEIDSLGVNVIRLINTHCHIDHVLGNAWACRQFNLLPEYHQLEEQQLTRVPLYAHTYGFGNYQESPLAKNYLTEGDELSLDGTIFKVLFVPGHCTGHIALYCAEAGCVISGDVLFQGSIGRTDLPGGNFDTLAESIRTKMYALPDETVVYSGHGEETTIGAEKIGNAFVRA